MGEGGRFLMSEVPLEPSLRSAGKQCSQKSFPGKWLPLDPPPPRPGNSHM